MESVLGQSQGVGEVIGGQVEQVTGGGQVGGRVVGQVTVGHSVHGFRLGTGGWR